MVSFHDACFQNISNQSEIIRIVFYNCYLLDVIVKVDKYCVPQTFMAITDSIEYFKFDANLLLEVATKLKSQRPSSAIFALFDFKAQYRKNFELKYFITNEKKIFVEI